MQGTAPSGTPPTDAHHVGGSRLGIGATLAVAMAVGPLAVFALSALSPVVTRELDLTPSEFGLLATLSFAAAAPTAMLAGRTADRFSTRATLYALFAMSAASLGLTAYGASYIWLVWGVVLAGIAMSVTNPVTNRAIMQQVPAGQRGAIMGAKQSGVQMGQMLVGLVLPSVAALTNWHVAVAALSAIVLLGVVLTRRYVPPNPPPLPRPGRVPGGGRLPRAVRPLLAYSFLAGAGLQAINSYLPLFAFERLSVSQASAGLTVALLGGVGLVARLAWGSASDRATSPRWVLMVMSLGGALSACLLVVAASTGEQWLLWLATVVCGATVVASNVVVMTAVVRIVDERLVGTATGVLAVGLYSGFTLGPVSFGALVERFGYATAWGIVAAQFTVAAIVAGLTRDSRQPSRLPA